MGEIAKYITKLNARIGELRAEKSQLDRTKKNNMLGEASYNRAATPLLQEIAKLEGEVSRIERSHEYAGERQVEAYFAERQAQRELESRVEARAAAQRAQRQRFDAEIAAYDFSMAHINDLPIVSPLDGKPIISDLHRRIGVEFAAELESRRRTHEQFERDLKLGLIQKRASLYGVSVESLQSELPPLTFEVDAVVDGQHFIIFSDDSEKAPIVLRNWEVEINAAAGFSDGGSESSGDGGAV